mgnify:CR=1 FL=1
MNFDKDAFAHGPIESKIWLCTELARTGLYSVDNIYVLGAWSGTMPFLLHAMLPVEYSRMILVDVNEDYLAQARVICNAIDTNGQLTVLNQDANTLEYNAQERNLIVNTSVDNIDGQSWWNCIPEGTAVALQSRTGGHRDCVTPYASLTEFNRAYLMKDPTIIKERQFVYPDHSYTRFMKIGIK